jgi:anion-transporting  ArsA/GET3 family ATPase
MTLALVEELMARVFAVNVGIPSAGRPATGASEARERRGYAPAMNVADLLAGKRVCICAGSGGVGKTTVSAAIAMGMAARGLKVAVITIDPARRLANSLGLDELGNVPRLVDAERFAEEGLVMVGELWAMMLDAKATFDDVVARLAPNPATRDQVLHNRIYLQLSSAVAGTQEYTAIAKLYELDEEGAYDLLVLDTPPSRNALDFLDAPDRLTDFLEGRALKLLLRPTGFGARIVGKGTGIVFNVLGRVTGVNLLDELSVFFRALGGMIDVFRERARRVKALLGAPATTFLIVTSPEREPVEEALFFSEKLAARRLPFGGAIVNRVHHDVLDDEDTGDVASALEEALGEKLAAKAAATLADYDVLARRDAAGTARLRAGLGGAELIPIPQFDADVHDIEGLLRIHQWLFAADAERDELFAAVTA